MYLSPSTFSATLVTALLVAGALCACSDYSGYGDCSAVASCYYSFAAGVCKPFTTCTAITDSTECTALTLSGCVSVPGVPSVVEEGCYPMGNSAPPIDNVCTPRSFATCYTATDDTCYFTTIFSLLLNGYPSVTTPCVRFTSCDAIGADIIGCLASATHGCRFNRNLNRCTSGGGALTPPATPVPTVACEAMDSVADCTATDRCYFQSTCKTFTTCENLGSFCSAGIRQLCLTNPDGQCYTQVPPPAWDSTCGPRSVAKCVGNTNCYVASFSSLVNGVLVETLSCRRFSSCAAISGDYSGCYTAAMRGCSYYNGRCRVAGTDNAPALSVAYGRVRFGGDASLWESVLTTLYDSLVSLLKAQIALARGIDPSMVSIIALRTGSLEVDVALAESNVGAGWSPADAVASIVASNSTMSSSLTTFFQSSTGSTQSASMISALNTSAPPPSPLEEDGGAACGNGCIAGIVVGCVAFLVAAAIVAYCLLKKGEVQHDAVEVTVSKGYQVTTLPQ
jgi:hypothetical protein